MKARNKELIAHIINIVTIALIVECFLCAMLAVRSYARKDGFVRIEETAVQASQMFNHSIRTSQDRLGLFANILAANNSNPDELLQTYMEHFCRTDYFSSACIHRANGTVISYGEHPHDQVDIPTFEQEVARLPYISPVYSTGDTPEEKCFYIAVPVVRNGETVGILYGYIFLDQLPEFMSSSAYGGVSKFYVVDGDSGDFMMDEYHDTLNNLYDGSMGEQEARKGYDIATMRDDVAQGRSGVFVFRSHHNSEWYYTYYMPLGINNWSLHLTLDESTAFASHTAVSRVMFVLALLVVVLMFLHVLALMSQTARTKEKDKQRLKKSQYINDVQSALLSAHNNPDHLSRALKLIAGKMEAETTLLLSFDERIVKNVHYWPSRDKDQVLQFMNRNIRSDFPEIYDLLTEGKSVFFQEDDPEVKISQGARNIFALTEVRNVLITPILDTSGHLKGAICAANMGTPPESPEMLECVTYDLFMAIANIENHAIIRRMGMMDYLTNVKNRNSYEKEVGMFTNMAGQSLWCVFVDVNGLHELNNTRGHKAGDLMLCAVADAIKRAFGVQYTYRVGGDEFVSFALDSSHEEFMARKHAITKELAAKGYFVSVGFAGVERSMSGQFDVEGVVSRAEAIMYQDKREFYQKNQLPVERGHFPERDK